MSYEATAQVKVKQKIGESNENLAQLLRQKSNEVSELKRKLMLLSTTDDVTGLYNRRHFIKRLNHEIARFQRYQVSACITILGIDNFTEINDCLGQEAGDLVLRQVAEILKSCMRGNDVLARFNGEEFTCLLPHTKAKDVSGFLTRIQHLVRLKPELTAFQITFSVGVAEIDRKAQSADLLIKKAALSLDRAKKTGKNKIVAATYAGIMRH